MCHVRIVLITAKSTKDTNVSDNQDSDIRARRSSFEKTLTPMQNENTAAPSVIPAKAGIQATPATNEPGFRVRGNDASRKRACGGSSILFHPL